MAASLTSLEVIVIVAVVILAVILVALGLMVIRRLRRRRDKLLHELKDSPELIQDRAFNRIAMARREAEILAGQGVDVTPARGLIAQAQGAFDTRNYDRAYESAQSAHEALVNARRVGGGVSLTSAPRGPPLPSAPPAAASSDGPIASSGSTFVPPPAPIPKNRVESQFQLHVLAEELERARAAQGPPAATQAADALRRQAEAAFAAGQYTDAFRLALRGRRELGVSLETLPAPSKGAAGASSSDEEPTTIDPGAAAERAASANRCPDCGYPMLPDDVFCRGCGRPKGEMKCPQCGAGRGPKDTFCGRCGERFP